MSKGVLVNVGSVGQSRIKGGIANWCLLNLNNGVIEMQSTPYNVNSLLNLVNNGTSATISNNWFGEDIVLIS